MSDTAIRPGSSGSFATSRRGGLTREEVRMVEALRARERPVSWQHIAARLGRSMEDVRRQLEPVPPASIKETVPAGEPWPFAPCAPEIEAIVRAVVEKHGTTLKQISIRQVGGVPMPANVRLARQEAFYSAKTVSGLSSINLSPIFGRPPASISEAILAFLSRAENDDQPEKPFKPGARTARKWTDGELALLNDVRSGKMMVKPAARALKCSPGTVRLWLNRQPA